MMDYNMDEHIGYIRMMYFVNDKGKMEVWDYQTFCHGLYEDSEGMDAWVEEWIGDLGYIGALDFLPECVASYGVWEISGELWARFEENYSMDWIGPEYDAYLWVGDDNLTFGKLDSIRACLLYTSPSPRDRQKSRMPSSA